MPLRKSSDKNSLFPLINKISTHFFSVLPTFNALRWLQILSLAKASHVRLCIIIYLLKITRVFSLILLFKSLRVFINSSNDTDSP